MEQTKLATLKRFATIAEHEHNILDAIRKVNISSLRETLQDIVDLINENFTPEGNPKQLGVFVHDSVATKDKVL